jgi:large subunit ribosomal protein L10
MPTAKKAQTIDEIADQLERASLIVVTDYRGLTMTELQTLRGTLRPHGGEFRIAKNTLTRIAAERVGIEGLEPVLEGPLALGLAYDDVVGFAKAVSDFARMSRILTVRGGIIERRFISAEEVEALSTLPSKEVLQATLLGMFKSPMRRTVSVLSGPSRSMAYLLQARADHMQGGDQAMAAD